MLRPISLAALVLLGLITHRAEAQVVQLPTFKMFAFSTTVRVPIGGSANLGGIGRSSASRVGGGGPLGGRGVARGRSAGGAQVTVTVHDFERMDRTLLAEAAARRGSREATQGTVDQRADARRTIAQQQLGSLSRGPVPGASSAHRPALGLAEIRRQRATGARAKESEALRLIDRAATAQSQGKYALAKMVYRMAAKKTNDDQLRQRISELMAAARTVPRSSKATGRAR